MIHISGEYQIRTDDLLITKQLLCQLSYSGEIKKESKQSIEELIHFLKKKLTFYTPMHGSWRFNRNAEWSRVFRTPSPTLVVVLTHPVCIRQLIVNVAITTNQKLSIFHKRVTGIEPV